MARDPRLQDATQDFRTFVADHGAAFDRAFPEDVPDRLDAVGRAA
ncbi:hypothetical protein [Actinacidiphila soli]|nr:hypothetical protein [Actinacidiphila soli]